MNPQDANQSQVPPAPQVKPTMSPSDPLGIGVVPLAEVSVSPISSVASATLQPSASHRVRWLFLLLIFALGGGGYYLYANSMLGSVVGMLPPSVQSYLPAGLATLGVTPLDGQPTADLASITQSSVVPREVVPSSGVIYKKFVDKDRAGFPQYDFYVFDKNTHKTSSIDMTTASDWKGEGGVPVILYTATPASDNKNTLTVAAYDMSTLSTQVIHVSDTTVPKSSLAFSPHTKSVGYCSDENEGSYVVEDLVSAQVTPYSSFSGCVADIIVDPPVFSKDKSSLYYKEAVGINDDGTQSSGFTYRELDFGTDTSSDITSVVFVTNQTPNNVYLAPVVHSTKKSTTVFNNSFDVYDISKSPKKIPVNLVANSPKVASAVVDDTSHVQSYVATDDGAGYFIYAYTTKVSRASEDDAKLGYLDLATKEFTFPLVSFKAAAKSVTLLKSPSKESVVFSQSVGSSTDLFMYTSASSTIEKIDSGVGGLNKNDIHFVVK
jgi:hypothetical protein